MPAVKVRKKVPKKKVPKRSPFHPLEQAQIFHEPKPPSALMEFITSLEGEIEYDEALREYQQEWCEHPKGMQEVVSTLYLPTKEEFDHLLRCNECGLIRKKHGRASASYS